MASCTLRSSRLATASLIHPPTSSSPLHSWGRTTQQRRRGVVAASCDGTVCRNRPFERGNGRVTFVYRMHVQQKRLLPRVACHAETGRTRACDGKPDVAGRFAGYPCYSWSTLCGERLTFKRIAFSCEGSECACTLDFLVRRCSKFQPSYSHVRWKATTESTSRRHNSL